MDDSELRFRTCTVAEVATLKRRDDAIFDRIMAGRPSRLAKPADPDLTTFSLIVTPCREPIVAPEEGRGKF